jgi:hypothetical protein
MRHGFSLLAVLTLTSCATAGRQREGRHSTLSSWESVVECVVLSARASQREAFASDSSIHIPIMLPRDVTDHILFRRASTVAGMVVLTSIDARDPRAGSPRPFAGPTRESRRLKQQLVEQCVPKSPIPERASGG